MTTKWQYEVWDIQTGKRVSKRVYVTRKSASKAAERMNQKYGAHRYAVNLKSEESR